MTLDLKLHGSSVSAPSRSRQRRHTWALAMLLPVSGAIVPSIALAQRQTTPIFTTVDSVRADGSVKKVPVHRPSPFSLFAAEDLAGGFYRSTGTMKGGLINEGGPAAVNQGGGLVQQHRVGNGNGIYEFFEMGLVMAAPPSEFRKIRSVYPGINAMSGSQGYTAHYWQVVAPPIIKRIGAADGQFGKAFAGVTATTDASCRNDTFTGNVAGFSLLAMKDCPETWAAAGYDGKRIVPDSTWEKRFASEGANFRWDEWKIAKADLPADAFLGTNSTYGVMSDYYREQRIKYGSVVPGGAGPPVDPGYPLGMEMRIDGWQFGSPGLRNTQFYQVTLVNKSADVYGTGIDYDSLYFGLGPGFLAGSQNGNQSYFDFSRGTMFVTKGNTSGRCSAQFPRSYTNAGVQGCANTQGFGTAGVYAMTFLKSPLGDLRNKLFTDPSSKYFNPTHPLAGDTITFNHAKSNSFGQTSQNINRSMRSAFGMIASKEDDYFDGRVPSDFTLANYVTLIQPEDWSGTYPALVDAKFPKFVPGTTTNPNTGQPFGKWDYNHDGVQDTIFVPGCGRDGCAALWSDSIAGGFRTNMGNILNTVSAGPFALKSGDTTQFLMAFTWGNDSTGIRINMEGLITGYFTNYEGPEPASFPTVAIGKSYSISSGELIDSSRFGSADATIGASISLRLPNINPVDAYFLRQVARVRQDSIDNVGRTRFILRLNPGLLNRLSARANDNLASVYIFKSCDEGNSWTRSGGNTATCINSAVNTVDGAPSAFPARPWSIVNYTNGVPASATQSETVQAGRSYMYSFVTRTRGFTDSLFFVIDSGANGLFKSDVTATLNIPKDTINGPLATSGPTVVNVYAPITDAAAKTYARIDTASMTGSHTQVVTIQNIQNDVAGSTKMVYGNRFIVRKQIDTLTSAATTTVAVQWVLSQAVTSPTGTPVANFVAREQTFTVDENIPVRNLTALVTGTQQGFAGPARIFVDTISSAAGAFGYVWVTSDNKPIFVTNDQYTANQVRDQQTSPLFPGFNVQSRDSANATSGLRQEVIPPASTRDRNFFLRANNDTATTQFRQFAPLVQNVVGTGTKRTRGGNYTLTWLVDPWGPGAPFVLDPVTSLQDVVTASLVATAPARTTITDVSAATATMVAATAARPLQRVRLPFTMKYTDPTSGRTEDVRFAMRRRISNTRIIGSGNDTLRVSIPDSLWMPGDTLIALHKIEKDSTVGTGSARSFVVTPETIGGVAGFRPVQLLVDSIALNLFGVACGTGTTASGVRPTTFTDPISCNPVKLLSRGASTAGGYLAVQPGWMQVFELTRGFDARTTVQLNATAFTSGNKITQEVLDKISVVPNPYLARSDLDALSGRTATPRVYFTGVPEQGTLRVYSISGQYLQELIWTRNDLVKIGNNTPSGDLPYNLRSREGIDLGSGLYLFVLTATGPQGGDLVKRGKFVILR